MQWEDYTGMTKVIIDIPAISPPSGSIKGIKAMIPIKNTERKRRGLSVLRKRGRKNMAKSKISPPS